MRVLLPSWHWLTPPPVSCALVHQTGWHEVDATTCQEIALLWALAWPLFFQTLANEIQMVVTTSLFGHMGETDLYSE